MITISKPPHNKYLLSTCEDSQYSTFASRYQKAKKYGFRAVFGYLSGAEIYQIAGEIGKGALRSWGRKKASAIVVVFIGWVGGPAILCFTNGTKFVRTAKTIHSGAAFLMELAEDSGNLVYLPIDLLFFGQPIPMGENNRFNILTNVTDFLE
jgi:hypothetical protein